MYSYHWFCNIIECYGWLENVIHGYGLLLTVIIVMDSFGLFTIVRNGHYWLCLFTDYYSVMLSNIIDCIHQLYTVIDGYEWLLNVIDGYEWF